ncbi:hypothetical protein SOVF_003440 [Spinacia oleracea]|nr:hypothetical protein SOVF_003440 [Spinacia oleracea]
MSWYTKSSKVVRTESMLDEYNIYFSHVLSPLQKKQQRINAERTTAAAKAHHHNHHHHHQDGGKRVAEKGCENVDDEAEKFIRKKHQKFELSIWNSTHTK